MFTPNNSKNKKKRLDSIDIFFKNKKINCINGKKLKMKNFYWLSIILLD